MFSDASIALCSNSVFRCACRRNFRKLNKMIDALLNIVCNTTHRSSDPQREGVASIDWPRATPQQGVQVVRRTAQDCRNWGGKAIQVMFTKHEPATCRAAQQEPFSRVAKPKPCVQGCGFPTAAGASPPSIHLTSPGTPARQAVFLHLRPAARGLFIVQTAIALIATRAYSTSAAT